LDVIVANLPYLPASAAARYPELAHEPFPAVFSAGDGLDVYRGLLQQAASKLAPEGVLLLQLHGEVLAARQPELPSLLGQLTGTARAQAA
jgi:methylase of polypeptide subunit release factors